MMLWWLSYAGGGRFRGAVIVEADDFLDACREASRRQINPGGQVLGVPILDPSWPPEAWRNRVLSWDECEELTRLRGPEPEPGPADPEALDGLPDAWRLEQPLSN